MKGMTNTQDYDDLSWLDGTTLDAAAGPLSGAVEVGDVARDAVELASSVSMIYGVPRRGATVLTPSGCC
jgi:hypothetical protein